MLLRGKQWAGRRHLAFQKKINLMVLIFYNNLAKVQQVNHRI